MTKKHLLLLPLLFGLLPSFGQVASPSFMPGRWYAGVKYEQQPYLATNRDYQPGLVVGFNLYPRLAVQAGLSVVPGFKNQYALQADLGHRYSGTHLYVANFSTGAYVPIFLRYLFSKPHRRWQTYGMVGIQTSFQSFDRSWVTYQDGQLINQEEPVKEKSLIVKPSIGAGMRVRLVDRLFLNAEQKVNYQRRLYSNWHITQQFGLGLQYE